MQADLKCSTAAWLDEILAKRHDVLLTWTERKMGADSNSKAAWLRFTTSATVDVCVQMERWILLDGWTSTVPPDDRLCLDAFMSAFKPKVTFKTTTGES
jgi:hypothetical protein